MTYGCEDTITSGCCYIGYQASTSILAGTHYIQTTVVGKTTDTLVPVTVSALYGRMSLGRAPR